VRNVRQSFAKINDMIVIKAQATLKIAVDNLNAEIASYYIKYQKHNKKQSKKMLLQDLWH